MVPRADQGDRRRRSNWNQQLAFYTLCFALELIAALLLRDLIRIISPPLEQLAFVLFWALIGVQLSLVHVTVTAPSPSVFYAASDTLLLQPLAQANESVLAPPNLSLRGALPDPFLHLPVAELDWRSLSGNRVIRYPIGRFRIPWPVELVSKAVNDKFGWHKEFKRPTSGPWVPPLKEVRQVPLGRRLRREGAGTEFADAHSVELHVGLDDVPYVARGLISGIESIVVQVESESWANRRLVVALTHNLNLRDVLHFQELSSYEPHPDSPQETLFSSLIEVHAPSWVVHGLVRAMGSDVGMILDSHIKQVSLRCQQLSVSAAVGAN